MIPPKRPAFKPGDRIVIARGSGVGLAGIVCEPDHGQAHYEVRVMFDRSALRHACGRPRSRYDQAKANFQRGTAHNIDGDTRQEHQRVFEQIVSDFTRSGVH